MSCTSVSEKSKGLSIPSGFYVLDNMLKWDSVANAGGYEVIYEGKTVYVDDNEYRLIYTEKKEYIVHIKALGDGENYLDSEYASYCYTPNSIKLHSPELSLSGNTLVWNSISNASGYRIMIIHPNSLIEYQNITECFYQIIFFQDGQYAFKVMALAENDLYSDSLYSDNITYYVYSYL
jgi:hypothetical protein